MMPTTLTQTTVNLATTAATTINMIWINHAPTTTTAMSLTLTTTTLLMLRLPTLLSRVATTVKDNPMPHVTAAPVERKLNWAHSASALSTRGFHRSLQWNIWDVFFSEQICDWNLEQTLVSLILHWLPLALASLQHFWQVPGPFLLLTDITLNSTCQTSLTSRQNTRGTGSSMFLQPARQRFERQQANFAGIQTLSVAKSRLIKWMAAGRASQCAPSTLSLAKTILLGSSYSSPQSIGTKDTFSSAEDNLCNHSEWSSSSLAFPTAMIRTDPYNPCTKPPTSLSKLLPHINSSTLAKCSTMESPRCGSTCCDTYCTLLYDFILSQLSLSLKLTPFCFWQ